MTVRSSSFGGSAPIVTTEYTSGAGTHTYNAATRYVRYVLVGGGAGGGRCNATTNGGGGGGAGATLEGGYYPQGASDAYEVGAAGLGATANNTAGTTGGKTSLGLLTAFPGRAGASGTGAGYGGTGSQINASESVFGGFAGGGGSTGTNGGSAPGFAGITSQSSTISFPGTTHTNPGGGGGGSSVYGRGGNGGDGSATTASAGANATGYGGGGGGGGAGTTSGNGGNGSGGWILIEEYA